MQCSCIGFATDVERSEISGGVKFSAWAEARALPINEQNYFFISSRGLDGRAIEGEQIFLAAQITALNKKALLPASSFELHRPASGDKINYQDDQRQDQKQMYESSQRVTGYQPNQPQHQQNHKDCPQHRCVPPFQ